VLTDIDMAKIVLREKIYVPVDDAFEYKDELDNRYVIDLFNEKGCSDCEFLPDRPTDTCVDCANYLSRKKLYTTVTKPSGQEYIGFPYGHKSMIPKIVPHVVKLAVHDLRPDTAFRTPLKFIQPLRPAQEEAVDVLVDLYNKGKLRGMLRAPPRTGKTVLAMALACRLRRRTLVFTNQDDLCKQFYETCMGGDNQEAYTNGPALKEKGVVSVIWAKKLEDYFKGDIVISTYQKFISDVGKERLAEIESLFAIVIADEVHRVAAPTFLKVMATMNTKGKLGLTATVTRKDGAHVLNEYVLGPVLHSMKTDTLKPTVVFHETGLFPSKSYSMWTYYCRWLEKNEDRTDMILNWVMKDLKADKSIVIPCVFTSQIHELTRRINFEWGRKIAESVTGSATTKSGKQKRHDAIDRAREGKTRVIVGTRSIIGTGMNVPAWDTLYWICPLANPENWYQEYSRILTPFEGKSAIIRMFLDGSEQTRGCLRSCLFKSAHPFPSLASQAFISPENWSIANAYLGKGKMEKLVKPKGSFKTLPNGRIQML